MNFNARKISLVVATALISISNTVFASYWCEQISTKKDDLPSFALSESNNWDIGPDGKKYNAQRAVRQQKQHANQMSQALSIGKVYALVTMLGGAKAEGGIDRRNQNANVDVDVTQGIYYHCGEGMKRGRPIDLSGAKIVFIESNEGNKYVYTSTSLTAIPFKELLAHIEANPNDPNVLEGTGWDFTALTSDGTEIPISDGTLRISNKCETDSEGNETCIATAHYKQEDVTTDGLSDRAYEALSTNPTFQTLKGTLTSQDMKDKTEQKKSLIKMSGNCLLKTGEDLNNGPDDDGQVNINCNKLKLDEHGNPILDNQGNPIVEEYTKSIKVDESLQCETTSECVEENEVEKTYDKGCFAPYEMEEYIVDKEAPAGNCATKQKKGLYRCESRRIVETKNCEERRNQSVKECVVSSRYDSHIDFIPGYVPSGQQYRVLFATTPPFPLPDNVVTARASFTDELNSCDHSRGCHGYTVAEVVPDEDAYKKDYLMIRVGSRGELSQSWQKVKTIYLDLKNKSTKLLSQYNGFNVYGSGDPQSTEIQFIDLGDDFEYKVDDADYRGRLDGTYSHHDYTAYAHWGLLLYGCKEQDSDDITSLTAEKVRDADGELNFYKYRCNIDFVGGYTTAGNDEFNFGSDTNDWAQWGCPSGMMHAVTTREYQCTSEFDEDGYRVVHANGTTGVASPRTYQKAKCYSNVHDVTGKEYYTDDDDYYGCGSSYTFKQGTLESVEPKLTGRFPRMAPLLNSEDSLDDSDPLRGYTPYPKMLISIVNDQNSCGDFKDKDPQFASQ